jgi:indolepyruvate decarboxylase
MLAQVSARITKRAARSGISSETLGPIVGAAQDPISADALYPRWANFFRPNDVIITDTGSSSLG